MKIIKPSIEVIEFDAEKILSNIEQAGRTCYKSEDKIGPGTAEKFIKGILKRKHTAMIEFSLIIIRVVCDRGVTHEIVRHRHFSFAQESTRYCNYGKDKFGNELTFIEPCFWNSSLTDDIENKEEWWEDMQYAEKRYLSKIERGATPQEARSILPNSLKTEIVIGGNLREWLHFFSLRTAPDAHPQMIEVATMLQDEFKNRLPILFKED